MNKIIPQVNTILDRNAKFTICIWDCSESAEKPIRFDMPNTPKSIIVNPRYILSLNPVSSINLNKVFIISTKSQFFRHHISDTTLSLYR